jgi:hypothetical protein
MLRRDIPLDTSTRNDLVDLTTDIGNLGRLRAGFKPEFAGGGPIGSLVTRAASKAGDLAPPNLQEQAAWWADFQRLVDLPARNKVFGASLSSNESASWEAAKNIKYGSNPELVQTKLAELEAIAQSKLGTIVEQETARGTNAAELDVFKRKTAPQSAQKPSAPKPQVRVRLKGTSEERIMSPAEAARFLADSRFEEVGD